MQRAILTALVLAAALSFGPAGADEPPTFQGYARTFTTVTPLEPAPITPITTARGGITNLGRFEGKVVLLNIWATWCPACVFELPALDRLQADLGGERFTVLAVSVDEDGFAAIRPYYRRRGVKNLAMYWDPGARIVKAFKLNHGLPWSFIIDDRGRIAGYLMGTGPWDSAEGEALIKHYIDHIGRPAE